MCFDVSAQGVAPTSSKVEAIVDWLTPTTVRDIRSFLGLASYYRRFIKDFSLIARPLTDLTKEKTPWKWKEDEEKAFLQLKVALATAPVMRLPDFDKEFVLTTDASLVHVGCILHQDFCNRLQPVAYASRKLTPTEARYSPYERELLAIIWSIGQWRAYLDGRKFTVQTDHSALKHLPNQASVNRQVWKWVSICKAMMWILDIS